MKPSEITPDLSFLKHLKSRYVFLIILAFFVFRNDGLAQSHKIDSLKSFIGSGISPEKKQEALLSLAAEYYYVNQDTSLIYSGLALEIARDTDDAKGEAMALKAIGNAHYVGGRMEKALVQYNNALEVLQPVENLVTESDILFAKASLLANMNLMPEAIATHKDNLTLMRKMADSLGVAEVMLDMVNVYRVIGDFQAFEKYLNQAETILETTGAQGQNHLMAVYYNKGEKYAIRDANFAKGVEYLLAALKISEDTEELGYRRAILANLGGAYFRSGDLILAENTYRKLHQLMVDHSISVNLPNVRQRLARTLKALGKTKVAIGFYRKSISGDIEMKNMASASTTCGQLALIYLQDEKKDSAEYFYQFAEQNLPDSRRAGVALLLFNLGKYNQQTGNPEKAEEYYLKAMELGKTVDYGSMVNVSQGLYQLYSQQGDYQKAFEFALLHKEVGDSITNKDQVREVTRLHAQFEHDQEIERKQSEIVLLEAEQENAKLKTTILLITIGMVIVIALFTARVLLMKKERRRKEVEEISRFKETMTGMIAHDLKNPLGVLLETESTSATGRNMTRQMLGLVENMLDVHKFEQTDMNLKKGAIELDLLLSESLDQIAALLEGKNIHLDYLVDRDLVVIGDPEIIQRIVINLLTNAIKYTPQNSAVTLMAKAEDGQVRLAVQDEGKGLDEKEIEEVFKPFHQLDPRNSGITASTGLGLTFCQMALEAHGTKMEVNSIPGEGAIFSFRLPVSTEPAWEGSSASKLAQKAIMTAAEKATIFTYLPRLKDLRIYDAYEIEKVLEEIKSDSQSPGIKTWITSVLNAAYSNNESYYKDLLQVE